MDFFAQKLFGGWGVDTELTMEILIWRRSERTVSWVLLLDVVEGGRFEVSTKDGFWGSRM